MPGSSAPKKRLAVVMGTRPEAIKLAPVVHAARSSSRFEALVICTGQHREIIDQMIEHFSLRVHTDLGIMTHAQDLCQVTTRALSGLYALFREIVPDAVIVQGDTTTTFCGALAGFYLDIPVAHVEAGLRTRDKRQPFPEEVNRRLTGSVAEFHFAPTESTRENLLREGVAPNRVWVTGNTSIDALQYTLTRRSEGRRAGSGRPFVLITAHRRENHGAGLERICQAVLDLIDRHRDLEFVYPVHPSPHVRETVFARLGSQARVHLVEPMNYAEFVAAMNDATLLLSDSGGVQEEAPALGKPVLVLRDVTERPEAVEVGAARLVGTDTGRIVAEVSHLLEDREHYARMSSAGSPYGDGLAARRIVDVLADSL